MQPVPTLASNTSSPWSPLKVRVFRAIWLASLASNLGTWMHEVGAAWLMTTLTTSPSLVALVQAAATLPMFALALPAGVVADLFDRRRLLLIAQGWMAFSALALAVTTGLELVTPGMLLALTAALAVGTAVSAPAWQALTPELVGFTELPKAVALNSLGFNIARATGPALGGLVLATLGPWVNFGLNGLSFAGVLLVLWRWRRSSAEAASLLPQERFVPALRLGARYVRHSPRMKTVLLRGGLFVLAASAWWALLPIVARFELGLAADGYGLLVGCFGAGAVAAASVLPTVRRRLSADQVALIASLVFAGVLLLLAFAPGAWVAAIAALVGGGAWLTVLSGYNVAAQSAVPTWVRARALSIYMLVFFGALAAGSSLWGGLAERLGSRGSLTVAAGLLLVGLLSARRSLGNIDPTRLAPSRHWPAPLIAVDVEAEEAPVLVTIEYLVDPARARDFVATMQGVGRSRRRTGSVRWGLWNDMASPDRWIESFVDESWLEHLRHHERLTALDADIEARALAFHRGDEPPVVRRYVAGKAWARPTSEPRAPAAGGDALRR